MKRMLMVVALLALSATGALAQFDNSIGMFTDDTVSVCNADAGVYATTSVYFYAILHASIPSINAVEFKVTNWPGAGGLITQAWNTTLVIGEPSTDIALAFGPEIVGPNAYLGRVDFFPLGDTWLGADYMMKIDPANGQTDVWIVPDEVEVAAGGTAFYFNYTGVGTGCDTATLEANWGSIKALY